jgi:ATP-dependent RNA helicase DeaD
MNRVHEVKVNDEEIAEFLPAIEEQLHDLTKQELIKRFASIEFNRFLDYYRNAPDLNAKSERGEGGEEKYMTGARLFINLGKMDGLDVPRLLELVDEQTGLGKKDIGRIDLKGAYSFFEVEKDKADRVVEALNGGTYKGRPVRVEVTDGKESSGGGDGGKPFKRGKTSYGKGGYGKGAPRSGQKKRW